MDRVSCWAVVEQGVRAGGGGLMVLEGLSRPERLVLLLKTRDELMSPLLLVSC